MQITNTPYLHMFIHIIHFSTLNIYISTVNILRIWSVLDVSYVFHFIVFFVFWTLHLNLDFTQLVKIIEYFEGFVKNYCNYFILCNKLQKFCTRPLICSYSTTRCKTELTVQINACHNDCNCCHKFRVTVNMNFSVNILLLINLSSWMQLSPINMNILFLMAWILYSVVNQLIVSVWIEEAFQCSLYIPSFLAHSGNVTFCLKYWQKVNKHAIYALYEFLFLVPYFQHVLLKAPKDVW